MVISRRAPGLASLALLLLVSTTSNLAAQGRQLTKDEEREAKAVTGALATVASGKPATNDVGLAWVRNDALQAQDDKAVEAFALTLDPSKVPSGKVFILWRVYPAGADLKDKKTVPIFESFSNGAFEGTPPFIGRLFLAPAGKVDVLVGLHEMVEGKGSKAPVSILKQTVDVPVLKGGELMISGLFPFRPKKYPAPLENILEHPYGTPEEENLPLANPTLSKGEPLRLSGMVFNATGRLSVEYTAFKEGSEEPVKKWAPAEIDPAKQGIPDTVPTTDFAPGNYRLEIKMTDKGSNKTLTESVKFVVGS